MAEDRIGQGSKCDDNLLRGTEGGRSKPEEDIGFMPEVSGEGSYPEESLRNGDDEMVRPSGEDSLLSGESGIPSVWNFSIPIKLIESFLVMYSKIKVDDKLLHLNPNKVILVPSLFLSLQKKDREQEEKRWQ